MAHWLDRLAVHAAGSPEPRAVSSAPPPAAPLAPSLSRQGLVGVGATELAARIPHDFPNLPVPPGDRPFSRLVGVRTLGLAAGLFLAAPLRTLGPSGASARSSETCLSDCLADAESAYREFAINKCNSGIPEPLVDFLNGSLLRNPLCQAFNYQLLINTRSGCRKDCGRKQPPPPAPPLPKRGPPPPPTGGCGFVGLTSCGATCCPAGSLCGAAGCIPPPPLAECTPPCPPGKKCQAGQCVDAAVDCAGVCPSGAKCCPSCGQGNFCWPAEVPCRC